MLSQKLQQKLLQKLSPQQILLMKLLQIPSMSLEQRIKQEIEENPALEEVGEFDDEFNTDNNEDFDNYEDGDSDVEGSEYDDQEPLRSAEDEFDFEDYLPDDEIPEYRLQSNNSSADDDQKESPFVSGVTFHELLAQQLGLRMLNDHEKMIGMHIIGNLDDAGYLSREIPAMVDDLAFIQNISTTAKELERILKIIQQFDPPGVGARTLRECLLIQLRRKPQSEAIDLAILVLDRYFNEFTKK
nr:RNA polymerase sigma-54 factor [Bacteroidales bacterium]